MKIINKQTLLATTIAVAVSGYSAPSLADHHDDMADKSDMKQHMSEKKSDKADKTLLHPELKNAWLQGKLETALLLNRHLNNFAINSDVKGNNAILKGKVESEIDRDLAEQVALSIDGIDSVDNKLKIDADKARSRDNSKERSFSQRLDDLTTTAMVKSKLLANENTHGLDVNVDTENGMVLLQGDVKSSEEKQLAGKIAENTEGVRKVDNQLKIAE